MILTKEQINRYMRHIIMPEISGPGQKKLLESTAFIYGENVKDISSLLYYLAASGIGHICCYFEDDDDYEALFHNIEDLNNAVSVELVNDQLLAKEKESLKNENSGAIFRIFLGSVNFISRSSNIFMDSKNENIFIPTIIAVQSQWKGAIQTFTTFNELNEFIGKLSYKLVSFKKDSVKISRENSYSRILTTSLLGTLCSIDGIKISLNLGETQESILYLDLFSMEFNKIEENKLEEYIEKLLMNNYDKNDSYGEIMKRLRECKVLIVGTGGLGSPVALALTMAGVGTIGLIDYDTVDISNLNRQILHATSRIGMTKVESAKIFLKSINPNINIITYNMSLNKDNAMKIIGDYDIIIDGVDNLPTRYLLNDACFFMKKPMIEAGVIRFTGLNTTILPKEGHCYRCIFPNMPQAGSVPSCSETGILGPVPGVMGFIEAFEAIKLATGIGNTLINKIVYFDAIDLEFTMIELSRNPTCPLCGENPSINILEEYEFICEDKL